VRLFHRPAFDAMVIWALPLATTVRDPETLAALIVEELRRRRILLPPIAVLGAGRRARLGSPRKMPGCDVVAG
jgi:Domain of unknown function (DUF4158)